MKTESSDAAWYRKRAVFCLELAASAQAAGPLHARLSLLAEAYVAKATDLQPRAAQAVAKSAIASITEAPSHKP
jgi:hypothetical protein